MPEHFILKYFFRIAGILFLICNSSCRPESDGVQRETGHEFNDSYCGEFLDHIAFPIGGIGAGMVCLEGTGAISHVSVHNQPDLLNEPVVFAAVTMNGSENGARVLEGPLPDRKIYGRPGAGKDFTGTTYGLPRFDQAEFTARFPFGKVKLRDDDIPLDITLEGWSPFIPLDPDNSSLPCGALEYTFVNNGQSEAEVMFSYHAVNFMSRPDCKNLVRSVRNGFILSNETSEESPHLQGDFAIFTDDNNTIVDHCWYREGRIDPLSSIWEHVKEGNPRKAEPVDSGAPGASLYIPFVLKPGESKKINLLMAWYVPYTKLRTGEEVHSENDPVEQELGDCLCDYYQPWYSARFNGIYHVADYWSSFYGDLKHKTERFTGAFYSSSLPGEVIEAVAANLTILKSPTLLRQSDGSLWGWEGCNDTAGYGPGSCTPVWNHAQAIPHLFPSLERSLRETEFFFCQTEDGHQAFRSALPVRLVGHSSHASADGQLGGIMKIYRDWRISGDDRWLVVMYPYVKQSLDYCIQTWDREERGVLEEPHHTTYEGEFVGPDGLCTSFYLGALKAFILIGEHLGDEVSYYRELLDRGIRRIESDLYNGAYFCQKEPDPEYQYGTGCLSDGFLGMWMARVCGLDGEIVNHKKIKNHLESIYRYNFKTDPFIHSNENWTGTGYQVASHLAFFGKTEEALNIVKAVRQRYDGRKWNPFSEYEQGYWNARAMASYGLLQGLTGVRYDAVGKTLYINSGIGNTFTSFFSCPTGFGNVGLEKGKPFVKMVVGYLDIERCIVSGKEVQVEIKNTN